MARLAERRSSDKTCAKKSGSEVQFPQDFNSVSLAPGGGET